MESFSAMPVFVAVIQAGGFSPAAKLLGISKSAVSKRITQLEEQLGVKLLYRTTRKLSLTEAGEHYFEHAAQAYQAASHAEEAVQQLQGEPQGRLRISTPMSFGRLHVAPMIPAFLKRYPKISLDMVMDDKRVDMVADGVDLAIRTGDLADSSLIARHLAPMHSVLCASPAYLAEHGMPRTLMELENHNCLIFSYSNDVKEWTFVKSNPQGDSQETVTVVVSGNYRVNNSEALHEAILHGIGIGRLPTFVAGKDIQNGRLIPLFPEYQMASITLNAVFLERKYMPAKVRAFLDFAVDYFGGSVPYWDRPFDEKVRKTQQ
ncbi:LysR family transcriptional regulator [Photobacterium japonica]|uniref:LysR family transcriptional regulator n=1 Tax=Photobacterium japonica TaxID=2910235 RepID=UPI003D0F4A18